MRKKVFKYNRELAKYLYSLLRSRLLRDEARLYDRVRQRKQREFVLSKYGNKCQCCDESRYEFLALDHVNGGGNKHRRERGVGGGNTFVRWAIKNNFPDTLRILCHNCNFATRYGNVCPHTTSV